MRKIQLLLLAIVSCALVSCNLDSESNFTPQIICGNILLNNTDTLSYKYDITTDKYLLDTIAVGDTVSFTFGFYTYGNNLQNIAITCNNEFATIKFCLDSAVTAVLTTESNLEKGILCFPINYNFVQVNLDYLPQVVNKTAEMQLKVASDSKFSPVEVSMITPIVAAE